ncbi:hypothetical protein QN326_04150 [Candidatus Phytoplasma asteris]|uniref:Uncharacterized protein n=1 Tax=Candidatus Phytoplasma asteris TaxID=85620 RepID=A0ABZ3CF35_9MOLU
MVFEIFFLQNKKYIYEEIILTKYVAFQKMFFKNYKDEN